MEQLSAAEADASIESREMKQVAQNAPLDDSDFNATPAVVDGAIYLRSDKRLYCLK